MSEAHEDDEAEEFYPPSKSQRKREAAALQSLGESLLTLTASELNHLEIPENLRTALEDALAFDSNEAKRRQRQYIGKLMRTIDPEPIERLLEQIQQRNNREKQHHHTLERWRERLIGEGSGGPKGALTDLLQQYPDIDVQRLRQLLRSHSREQQQGKPPRSFREIYQLLSQTITD